jgi:hypothetical protein
MKIIQLFKMGYNILWKGNNELNGKIKNNI